MNDDNIINKKLINDFANLIGNLQIAIYLDSLKDVRNDYQIALNEILTWIDYYYKAKNLDIVTYEKSLKIHDLLYDIRCKLLPDKKIGIEALLTDDILIRYEVIIKLINNERSEKKGKR